MSLDCRHAAQVLIEEKCYRSSISRSYYAAYAAITSKLAEKSITYPQGRGNPSHASLPGYVLNNLTYLPHDMRFWVSDSVKDLFKARADADYVPPAVLDEQLARNMLRSATRIMGIMEVK